MARKTPVYLPDDLKAALEREAARRGSSEADVIRRANEAAVAVPTPRGGFLNAEPFAERDEELLNGFGER